MLTVIFRAQPTARASVPMVGFVMLVALQVIVSAALTGANVLIWGTMIFSTVQVIIRGSTALFALLH